MSNKIQNNSGGFEHWLNNSGGGGERDILIVFEDAWEMADMTGILSHICSTGENGKSLGKRAKNAPSLKKVDVWFLFSFLAKKDIEQCSC